MLTIQLKHNTDEHQDRNDSSSRFGWKLGLISLKRRILIVACRTGLSRLGERKQQICDMILLKWSSTVANVQRKQKIIFFLLRPKSDRKSDWSSRSRVSLSGHLESSGILKDSATVAVVFCCLFVLQSFRVFGFTKGIYSFLPINFPVNFTKFCKF